MTAARQRAERRGRLAELLVCLYYRLCGYRLLRSRYRNRQGEIDLIMARPEMVVFIEVKYRASDDEALESILPPGQQHRLRAAAAQFLARSPLAGRDARFDVVVIQGWWRWRIFRNAI